MPSDGQERPAYDWAAAAAAAAAGPGRAVLDWPDEGARRRERHRIALWRLGEGVDGVRGPWGAALDGWAVLVDPDIDQGDDDARRGATAIVQGTVHQWRRGRPLTLDPAPRRWWEGACSVVAAWAGGAAVTSGSPWEVAAVFGAVAVADLARWGWRRGQRQRRTAALGGRSVRVLRASEPGWSELAELIDARDRYLVAGGQDLGAEYVAAWRRCWAATPAPSL